MAKVLLGMIFLTIGAIALISIGEVEPEFKVINKVLTPVCSAIGLYLLGAGRKARHSAEAVETEQSAE